MDKNDATATEGTNAMKVQFFASIENEQRKIEIVIVTRENQKRVSTERTGIVFNSQREANEFMIEKNCAGRLV
jgi:hypothetical protein